MRRRLPTTTKIVHVKTVSFLEVAKVQSRNSNVARFHYSFVHGSAGTKPGASQLSSQVSNN
eukprot:scaffold9494_cov84-Cylindrotheca_fusiformis.AAC.2